MVSAPAGKRRIKSVTASVRLPAPTTCKVSASPGDTSKIRAMKQPAIRWRIVFDPMIGTIERTNGGRSDFLLLLRQSLSYLPIYNAAVEIKGMPPSGSGRVSDALYNVSRRAQ